MPKVDIRELDFIDDKDDFINYEKIKKPKKSKQNQKDDEKKHDVIKK